MANVKRIHIEGVLPFDVGAALALDEGHEAEERTDDLLRMLGQMGLPSMGTRMKWGREKYVSNVHGGRTAMYPFTLGGEEALSWDYLDRFKELVGRVGGEILTDRTEDMEA